jgi:hypothetical protein
MALTSLGIYRDPGSASRTSFHWIVTMSPAYAFRCVDATLVETGHTRGPLRCSGLPTPVPILRSHTKNENGNCHPGRVARCQSRGGVGEQGIQMLTGRGMFYAATASCLLACVPEVEQWGVRWEDGKMARVMGPFRSNSAAREALGETCGTTGYELLAVEDDGHAIAFSNGYFTVARHRARITVTFRCGRSIDSH